MYQEISVIDDDGELTEELKNIFENISLKSPYYLSLNPWKIVPSLVTKRPNE